MLDDKQGAAQSADSLIFECLFCIVLYRCVCLSLFFFIFRPSRWSSLLVRDGHFLFMYNLQLLDLLLRDQRKRLRSACIPLVKEAKPSVCPFLLSCYPLSLFLSLSLSAKLRMITSDGNFLSYFVIAFVCVLCLLSPHLAFLLFRDIADVLANDPQTLGSWRVSGLWWKKCSFNPVW